MSASASAPTPSRTTGHVIDAELLELLYILEEVASGVREADEGIRRFPVDRQLLIIACTSTGNLKGPIQAAGGRILSVGATVATAEVPLTSIRSISALPGIREIRLSRLLSPKMDKTLLLTRAHEYRRRLGSAGRGQGVIIGVVDSGIDGTHPAFSGRILECWNQTNPGLGGRGATYGTIENHLDTTDENGHGTHIAGIAAGDYGDMTGMAPNASIIPVKSDLEDAHVIDAVRYIFRRAATLGMPAVVNLSLGGHGDPHDGTDALSTAIDEESGPGRIVVAAAGNEGLDNIHFTREVGRETAHVAFCVPHNASRVVLNLWYEGDGELEVAVSSPFGTSTAYQRTRLRGNATQAYELASLARVYVTTPGRNARNGDKPVRIMLQRRKDADMIQPGRWFIHLRNGGKTVTVHGWTIDDSPSGDVTWVEPSNAFLIGSPGAARAAITAAALISRNEWMSEDGSSWSLKFELNTIAPSSSPGPLRSGGRKPDFAVPGGMIIAARSAQANFDRDNAIDDLLAAMLGTSMATGVLSGMCAILLERHPEWGPDEVRAALTRGSRGTFNSEDGMGVVTLDRCP